MDNWNRASRMRIACFVAMLSLFLATGAFAQDRVVAIGDVHGAYPEFVSILQKMGLIDSNRRWSGGTATLVQLGDLIDRGRQSRACLDLLMEIERQAKRSGGRVIPMLGNHEILNILGDFRYVTLGIYGAFASGGLKRDANRPTTSTGGLWPPIRGTGIPPWPPILKKRAQSGWRPTSRAISI